MERDAELGLITSMIVGRRVRLGVGALALLVFGVCGCGGNHDPYGTFSVSGIVVTYPVDLTSAVTLNDLTPAGAGLPIGIWEESGSDGDASEYYKSHALPKTDSNGRFTIMVDSSIPDFSDAVPTVTAEILVLDRCSTTAIAYSPYSGGTDGSAGNGGSIQGAGTPESSNHVPDDQLINAGILAQGHFGTDIVIVVSSNPDTCLYQSFAWPTGP